MFDTEIDSTSELISIALAAERGAIRRYSNIATKMHTHGNEEAAAEFETLVSEAQSHEKKLTEWALLEELVIDVDATPVRWEDPDIETRYDVQARNPYRCTAYKALAFAVHNKERAFLFYTYVAADSHDADVCHHAKVLARTELEHAALLRIRRRQAWCAQTEQIAESRIDPAVINGTPDLLAIIVFIEQYLMHLFKLAVRGFPEIDSLAVRTQSSLAISEKELHAAASPDSRVITVLEKLAQWSKHALEDISDATTALRRLCADCDRSFTFYDLVIKSTQDEAVLLMAQRHSILATQRIVVLRSLTDRLIAVQSSKP